jgi:hypothetical protein
MGLPLNSGIVGNTVYLQYGIISHLFVTLCIGNCLPSNVVPKIEAVDISFFRILFKSFFYFKFASRGRLILYHVWNKLIMLFFIFVLNAVLRIRIWNPVPF